MRRNKEPDHPAHSPPQRHLGVMGDDPTLVLFPIAQNKGCDTKFSKPSMESAVLLPPHSRWRHCAWIGDGVAGVSRTRKPCLGRENRGLCWEPSGCSSPAYLLQSPLPTGQPRPPPPALSASPLCPCCPPFLLLAGVQCKCRASWFSLRHHQDKGTPGPAQG